MVTSAAILQAAVHRAVTPRRPQSPWQWAEKYVKLGIRTTNSPGRYRSDWVAYVRGWHDAFIDPAIREVAICANAQGAKTETLMNCVRYAVAEDPGPMLWVMPAETLARSFSETRLQPSLKDCPPCAAQIQNTRDKFKILEMHLCDMTINLAGANSPAQLASRPVRYLFLDEVDKFPGVTQKEAGAVDLAKLRTTTFWNRKTVITSTPTVEGGPIWQAWLEGDQRRYFCPCPNCGEKQHLRFDQLKWPSKKEGRGWDLKLVEDCAGYECEHCGTIIDQAEKGTMIREGEWCATNLGAPRDKASYHINALYSPWRSWGSVAREFLESKGHTSKLQNFANSILAEPWKDAAEEITSKSLLEKRGEYKLKDRPEGVLITTIAADVGRDYFAVTVRGWGEGGESWLLDYAKLLDFEHVKQMADEWDPVMGFMDSGFRTQEVYEFCSRSDRLWHPTKGHDVLAGSVVRASPITFHEGKTAREFRIHLYHFAGNSFKGDLYLRRIQDGDGPAWHIPADVGIDFLGEMTAEQLKPRKNQRGVETQQWVQVRADNHYGDCEVLQLVMGHLLARRMVPKKAAPEKPEPVKPRRTMNRSRKPWR